MPFQDCSQIGWVGKKVPLSKICHTYAKIVKLGTNTPYLKTIQKIYKSREETVEIF